MLFSLCPGSWHHIQNLDSFFTKISFVLDLAGQVPSLAQDSEGAGVGGLIGGVRGRYAQERPIMSQAYFLTHRPHLQLPPAEWLCLYPAGGCLPAGVRCLSREPLCF